MARTISDMLDASTDVDGCWVPSGEFSRSPAGYLNLWDGDLGRNVSGHRAAYELLMADIPPGLVIDHLCMRKDCINPWHMDPVTPSVNTERAAAVRRHPGHDYRKMSSGRTHCHTCRMVNQRRRRAEARMKEGDL